MYTSKEHDEPFSLQAPRMVALLPAPSNDVYDVDFSFVPADGSEYVSFPLSFPVFTLR